MKNGTPVNAGVFLLLTIYILWNWQNHVSDSYKYMRWFLTWTWLFILVSCTRNPLPVLYNTADGFVLEDTCREASAFKLHDRGYCNYPIYYTGPVSDTVRTGRQYNYYTTNWNDARYFHFSRSYTPVNLKILVDTTVHTNCRLEYTLPGYKVLEDSTLNYHAYLVTIRNISDSIIFMGRSFALYLAWREAKNREGKWVKTERTLHETGICGTNQPEIFLFPREIIISKLPRYTGNLVTECRLAFGFEDKVVYSNTFKDAIDEKILISSYENH